MSEPVGRGGSVNGSSKEDDDGEEQMEGERLSSDLVDAWKSKQLHPSYSGFSTGAEGDSQEDDDAFGSLLRETFQAYNDSNAGDPVASVENVETVYPAHERISHSTDGENTSGTELNDLFAEVTAALYDSWTNVGEEAILPHTRVLTMYSRGTYLPMDNVIVEW